MKCLNKTFPGLGGNDMQLSKKERTECKYLPQTNSDKLCMFAFSVQTSGIIQKSETS